MDKEAKYRHQMKFLEDDHQRQLNLLYLLVFFVDGNSGVATVLPQEWKQNYSAGHFFAIDDSKEAARMSGDLNVWLQKEYIQTPTVSTARDGSIGVIIQMHQDAIDFVREKRKKHPFYKPPEGMVHKEVWSSIIKFVLAGLAAAGIFLLGRFTAPEQPFTSPATTQPTTVLSTQP